MTKHNKDNIIENRDFKFLDNLNILHESSTFSECIMDKINCFCINNDLTSSTFFLFIMAVTFQLLEKSKLDSIVIPYVTSGRLNVINGFEYMIGLFNNIIPIVINLSNKKPIMNCLKEIQNKRVAIMNYEYCTIQQIALWCKIPPLRL